MEYHCRRPLPERRSSGGPLTTLYTATAERPFGGGLKPLPKGRSAVAYAYVSLSRPLSERRSAVAVHNVVNGPPPIAFPAVAFGLFNLSFCLI